MQVVKVFNPLIYNEIFNPLGIHIVKIFNPQQYLIYHLQNTWSNTVLINCDLKKKMLSLPHSSICCGMCCAFMLKRKMVL